jgi:hypothetical protein
MRRVGCIACRPTDWCFCYCEFCFRLHGFRGGTDAENRKLRTKATKTAK